MQRRRRTYGRAYRGAYGRVSGYGLALALLLTACTGGGPAGPGATVSPAPPGTSWWPAGGT